MTRPTATSIIRGGKEVIFQRILDEISTFVVL